MKAFSDSVKYIGVDDNDLDLFEGQYIVPNGVSYNSYVITDDKIAVMDTVDIRGAEGRLKNLEGVLEGKAPDYLVISHMEPDHSACIKLLRDKYPDIKLVGNPKTFVMLKRFFGENFAPDTVEVKEGDKLSLGEHELSFIMAPMIHWPEVMMSFEEREGILFSADAFGKFGALSADEDWSCEARRYYFNIVGKYGMQVQNLLKKAANLPIKTICPLHGPILTENLEFYVGKYSIWSSYAPEDRGVLIAYASIYGNTKAAALRLEEELNRGGAEKVSVMDLSRCDMAEAVEDAFRYDRIVLASPTLDGGIFPKMEEFLMHLKSKNFQNRVIGIIENGSWAPVSGKLMIEAVEKMKGITVCEPKVTVNSALDSAAEESIKLLAKNLLKV